MKINQNIRWKRADHRIFGQRQHIYAFNLLENRGKGRNEILLYIFRWKIWLFYDFPLLYDTFYYILPRKILNLCGERYIGIENMWRTSRIKKKLCSTRAHKNQSADIYEKALGETIGLCFLLPYSSFVTKERKNEFDSNLNKNENQTDVYMMRIYSQTDFDLVFLFFRHFYLWSTICKWWTLSALLPLFMWKLSFMNRNWTQHLWKNQVSVCPLRVLTPCDCLGPEKTMENIYLMESYRIRIKVFWGIKEISSWSNSSQSNRSIRWFFDSFSCLLTNTQNLSG